MSDPIDGFSPFLTHIRKSPDFGPYTLTQRVMRWACSKVASWRARREFKRMLAQLGDDIWEGVA